MTEWECACLGWFVGLMIVAVYYLIRFRMIQRGHERKIAELDAIDAITSKAAAAKTTEAYEYYMSEAVRRLDEYSKRNP